MKRKTRKVIHKNLTFSVDFALVLLLIFFSFFYLRFFLFCNPSFFLICSFGDIRFPLNISSLDTHPANFCVDSFSSFVSTRSYSHTRSLSHTETNRHLLSLPLSFTRSIALISADSFSRIAPAVSRSRISGRRRRRYNLVDFPTLENRPPPSQRPTAGADRVVVAVVAVAAFVAGSSIIRGTCSEVRSSPGIAGQPES